MKNTRTNKDRKSVSFFKSVRTLKRKNHIVVGGGSENTKLAVITFVRNIASQILNSIEIKEDLTKNTRFFNLSDDKKGAYASLYHEMNINFDKFKSSAGVMINERNESIHPPLANMLSMAIISRDLITEYSLGDKMSFEFKILQSFINPKRVTRSMSLQQRQTADIPSSVMVTNNRWAK